MESEAEENFVDVPERPTEVLELPIRVTREKPGNDPRSWAERVAGEQPTMNNPQDPCTHRIYALKLTPSMVCCLTQDYASFRLLNNCGYFA